MRHGWILLLIGLVALAGCAAHDRELLGDPEPARVTPTNSQQFDDYDEGAVAPDDSLEMFADLRFYGGWHELYPFGWVWRPTVVREWSPMTEGHWVWTSYGWMWVSYDPFGWATYNYGYWVHDFMLGWVWIPDYLWEPVRADWFVYDDYICWAPLPPPGVRYKEPWNRSDDPWVAVPAPKFKNVDVGRERVQPKYKRGSSERTLRRTAPDPNTITRSNEPLKLVNVQLERGPVGAGGMSFTRVVLPASEQAIVNNRRPTQFKQPPPSINPGTPNNPGSTQPESRPAKEKTSSPPPAKQESPKFKEKAKDSSDEKSKSGGSDKKGKGR